MREPLARAGRGCERPGCASAAAATLRIDYASREVRLCDLTPHPPDGGHDLCTPHADRTRPPHGWGFADERTSRPADEVAEGRDAVVAVLAAALGRDRPGAGNAVPDGAGGPAADGVGGPPAEGRDAPDSADGEPAPRPVIAVRAAATADPGPHATLW